MSLKREQQQMIRKIEKQGWSMIIRRNGHLFLVAPSGKKVTCGSTPSDRRSLLNLRAQLRREGADL